MSTDKHTHGLSANHHTHRLHINSLVNKFINSTHPNVINLPSLSSNSGTLDGGGFKKWSLPTIRDACLYIICNSLSSSKSTSPLSPPGALYNSIPSSRYSSSSKNTFSLLSIKCGRTVNHRIATILTSIHLLISTM